MRGTHHFVVIPAIAIGVLPGAILSSDDPVFPRKRIEVLTKEQEPIEEMTHRHHSRNTPQAGCFKFTERTTCELDRLRSLRIEDGYRWMIARVWLYGGRSAGRYSDESDCEVVIIRHGAVILRGTNCLNPEAGRRRTYATGSCRQRFAGCDYKNGDVPECSRAAFIRHERGFVLSC